MQVSSNISSKITQIVEQMLKIETDITNHIKTAKNIAQQLNRISEQYYDNTTTDDLISESQTLSIEGSDENFISFHEDLNYNEQYWKMYLKNQISLQIIQKLDHKSQCLQRCMTKIQEMQETYWKLYKLKNRKKNRRNAVEIDKDYICPYENCIKVYGSDVSLNLHIKLKHKGGNKTDRQKLAQQICLSEQKGQQSPHMTLNLPTGYLEQFRKIYFKDEQQLKIQQQQQQ